MLPSKIKHELEAQTGVQWNAGQDYCIYRPSQFRQHIMFSINGGKAYLSWELVNTTVPEELRPLLFGSTSTKLLSKQHAIIFATALCEAEMEANGVC